MSVFHNDKKTSDAFCPILAKAFLSHSSAENSEGTYPQFPVKKPDFARQARNPAVEKIAYSRLNQYDAEKDQQEGTQSHNQPGDKGEMNRLVFLASWNPIHGSNHLKVIVEAGGGAHNHRG